MPSFDELLAKRSEGNSARSNSSKTPAQTASSTDDGVATFDSLSARAKEQAKFTDAANGKSMAKEGITDAVEIGGHLASAGGSQLDHFDSAANDAWEKTQEWQANATALAKVAESWEASREGTLSFSQASIPAETFSRGIQSVTTSTSVALGAAVFDHHVKAVTTATREAWTRLESALQAFDRNDPQAMAEALRFETMGKNITAEALPYGLRDLARWWKPKP